MEGKGGWLPFSEDEARVSEVLRKRMRRGDLILRSSEAILRVLFDIWRLLVGNVEVVRGSARDG